jgi:hypothetical protein
MTISFKVVTDGLDFLVVDASIAAYSFAMVPAKNQAIFADKATALEQVRRLAKWQAKGNQVETRMMETPDRFEAVADTRYGVEW